MYVTILQLFYSSFNSILVDSEQLIPEEILEPEIFHNLEETLQSRWDEHAVNKNYVSCKIVKALKALAPADPLDRAVLI